MCPIVRRGEGYVKLLTQKSTNATGIKPAQSSIRNTFSSHFRVDCRLRKFIGEIDNKRKTTLRQIGIIYIGKFGGRNVEEQNTYKNKEDDFFGFKF